jgi:hypothetical protein
VITKKGDEYETSDECAATVQSSSETDPWSAIVRKAGANSVVSLGPWRKARDVMRR